MIGVNDLSNYVKYKTHTNCCADDLRSMKAKTETSKSVATVSPSLLPYFPWQRPLSLSSPWLEELQHLVEVLFLAAYFYHNRGSRTDVPRCRRSFCHCNKKTREKRKRKKIENLGQHSVDFLFYSHSSLLLARPYLYSIHQVLSDLL